MDESVCGQEKYVFGKSIADSIYENKNDKSQLIKKIKNRKEAEITQKAGELGIAPKIYDIVSCVHTEKKPKYSVAQQRERAKGKTIPREEINYEIKEKEMHYMVMQNLDGHELRKGEVDDNMDEIYDKYSQLYENGIVLLDIARQNIMIERGRVYLIDYEHTTTPSENEKKKTKEEIRNLLYYQRLYQESRSRSRSRSRSHSKGGKKKKTQRNYKNLRDSKNV